MHHKAATWAAWCCVAAMVLLCCAHEGFATSSSNSNQASSERDAYQAADGPSSAAAIGAATNAYEGEAADVSLLTEALAAVFKPIYSHSDPSTHEQAATTQPPLEAPAAAASSNPVEPDRLVVNMPKGKPSQPIGTFLQQQQETSKLVSIDDLSLGMEAEPTQTPGFKVQDTPKTTTQVVRESANYPASVQDAGDISAEEAEAIAAATNTYEESGSYRPKAKDTTKTITAQVVRESAKVYGSVQDAGELSAEEAEAIAAATNTYEESGNYHATTRGEPTRRLLLANKITPGAGSNAPGSFTGGPSLSQQHSAWKSDNPKDTDPAEDGRATYVAAGGIAGAVNRNVFQSLNNDLTFYINSGGRKKSLHRQLLDGTNSDDAAAAAAAAAAEEDDGETVGSSAAYTAGAFDLPVAAVQAARLQVEELQQVLSANRVPRVQIEHAAVPDAPLMPTEADTQDATPEVTAVPSSSHRKLKAGAAAPAASPGDPALLGSDTGTGGKPLWGVTYSWRRAEACDGGRQLCRCPHPDELDTDLDLLYRYSYRIRTYSVECPELMRMMLHHATANSQVSWLLGMWVGRDPAANKAQIDLLASLLKEHPHANLAGIAVGNEAITRGDVTQQQLVEAITKVRIMVRNMAKRTQSETLLHVPVLTVELPAAFTSELAAAVDVVGINVQPFFSAPVDTTKNGWTNAALGIAVQQFNQLQQKAKGKQVVVTEIGWPSRSGEMDVNRGTIETAAAFARAWVQAAGKLNIPYYYHELADAAWKTSLRQGTAAAAAAATQPKQRTKPQPSLLSLGVMGDEHFGLVTADRKIDKGLLPAAQQLETF